MRTRLRPLGLLSAIAVLLAVALASPASAQTPKAITPECPTTIVCTFIPAAYQQNSSAEDYGNYDVADRPNDGMTINQIVWHDIEGDCPAAIKEFQDPLAYVSAHYLVCPNADGSVNVVQMVQDKNIAWHAANYYVNMHSIGVEIAGYATDGYPPEVYRVAAQLGKYLAEQDHIPLDPQHMVGHQNVPPPNTANIGLQHMDPGPFFNWQLFYQLLGVNVHANGLGNPQTASVITVAPNWQSNKQVITGCFPEEPTKCVTDSSPQPTSLLYVHTGPSLTSPLVSDAVLGQGTTDIGNEVAKVYFGQQFVAMQHTASCDGMWYQIGYDGGAGWILSPWTSPAVFAGTDATITPKPGLTSIPLYGRAYPKASTYPSGFAGPAVSSLPYTITQGQRYTVAQADTLTQWYNDATINYSEPYDHVVFTSTDPDDQYVAIQFYGRQMFVKLSDVLLAR